MKKAIATALAIVALIDGYKTYLAAIAISVYSFLIQLGVPSEPLIWGVIGTFSLYGIRGAFRKLIQATKGNQPPTHTIK
jgi:hypothetical protein